MASVSKQVLLAILVSTAFLAQSHAEVQIDKSPIVEYTMRDFNIKCFKSIPELSKDTILVSKIDYEFPRYAFFNRPGLYHKGFFSEQAFYMNVSDAAYIRPEYSGPSISIQRGERFVVEDMIDSRRADLRSTTIYKDWAHETYAFSGHVRLLVKSMDTGNIFYVVVDNNDVDYFNSKYIEIESKETLEFAKTRRDQCLHPIQVRQEYYTTEVR